MTLTELKSKLIAYGGCESALVFENPDYVDACIGIDRESGRVIYSYTKMIEYLMRTDGMTDEEATEFIEYNSIRSLPYAGESAPIVMYQLPTD